MRQGLAGHARAACSGTCLQRPRLRPRWVACSAGQRPRWEAAGLAAGLTALGCLLAPAAQAAAGGDPGASAHWHPVAADLNSLASGENEQFWKNFVQYGRFFTSVLVRAECRSLHVRGGGLHRPPCAARSWARPTSRSSQSATCCSGRAQPCWSSLPLPA